MYSSSSGWLEERERIKVREKRSYKAKLAAAAASRCHKMNGKRTWYLYIPYNIVGTGKDRTTYTQQRDSET